VVASTRTRAEEQAGMMGVMLSEQRALRPLLHGKVASGQIAAS
jgi:hypothetical protein